MRRDAVLAAALAAALLAIATTACRQAGHGPAQRPAGSSVAPEAQPGTTLHGQAPPRLDDQALARYAEQLRAVVDLSSIPAAPALDRPGPLIYAPAPARAPVMDSKAFTDLIDTRKIAPGERRVPLGVHDLLLKRLPAAEVTASGLVTLRTETLHPLPAASAYFGTTLPEQRIQLPRLRKLGRVQLDATRTLLRAQIDLNRLLGPNVDIAHFRLRGRGVVAYRLELLDDRYGTSRLYDGRVAFRCTHRPCARTPSFVQLPTITLGPFVDLVTTETAVISWDTDRATAGQVILLDADGNRRAFVSDQPATHHEVRLKGLQPDARYRYHAVALDRRGEYTASPGAVFRTAPRSARPFTFAVMGDSRSGVDVGEASYLGLNARVLKQLLQRADERSAELIVFGGDLVNGYTTSPGAFRLELQAWKQTVQPFGALTPIYEAMGNHEAVIDAWKSGWGVDKSGAQSSEAIFAEAFVNPRNGPAPSSPDAPPYRENVYSFDYASAHIAVVNSNYWFRSHFDRTDHPAAGKGNREGTVTAEQIDWLDKDLAAARKRGARHLFLVSHEPAFPNGGHAQDAMYWNARIPAVLAQRDRFWNVLAKHAVTAAFFGDEHNYSRTLIDASVRPSFRHPVWQIISGGSGAPYYARDESVPWRNQVRAFSAQQHLVLVRIDGTRAELEAISVTGQVLDRWDLSQH